jgi:metallo-beta-lactamase superfamily protein
LAKVPEQIAPGVYRVDAVKIPYVVSVLLIRDDDGWALVDAGRSSLRIQQALAALGAEPDELRRIYLTHHHAEHASGLPNILWWAPNAELTMSEYEAQIMSGKRAPDPLSDPVSSFIAIRGLPTIPADRIRPGPHARPHLVAERPARRLVRRRRFRPYTGDPDRSKQRHLHRPYRSQALGRETTGGGVHYRDLQPRQTLAGGGCETAPPWGSRALSSCVVSSDLLGGRYRPADEEPNSNVVVSLGGGQY